MTLLQPSNELQTLITDWTIKHQGGGTHLGTIKTRADNEAQDKRNHRKSGQDFKIKQERQNIESPPE